MAGAADRLRSLGDWNKRMSVEMTHLPETLERLRTGVDDLSRVAARLEALTEVLERTQAHLDRLGISDTARQVDDATAKLQDQVMDLQRAVAGTTSAAIQESVDQLTRTVNFFLRPGGRRDG